VIVDDGTSAPLGQLPPRQRTEALAAAGNLAARQPGGLFRGATHGSWLAAPVVTGEDRAQLDVELGG